MAHPDEMPAAEDSSAHGAFWLPRTAASDLIEKIINGVGGVINWIWGILMLVIVVNVVMRYALATNGAELDPGDRYSFSSRLAAPDEGVKSVAVTFVEDGR